MTAVAYIENPRRGPRAPARCTTKVICPAGVFEAETEDIGSHGCQLVSPRAVKKGDPVKLTISNSRVPDALRISGRIAWASAQAPWRLGVAFDDEALDDSGRWFDRLVAAFPGLAAVRRIPPRISVDAMVYLGPPPRFVVDFDRHEAAILRAIGSGTSVGELMARLRDDWPPKQRALFSLLAHQHLTLARGGSVHPESWKRILADLEGTFAVEALRAAPTPPPLRAVAPTAARPAPRPAPTPIPVAAPPRAPTPAPGDLRRTYTPLPFESRSVARGIDGGASWAAPAHPPAPDYSGAGVGWRAPTGPRPSAAQECFELAHAEIAAGRVNGALALLRRALALAPGDPEIAGAIGKLAFKDRLPGSR
ncbi:PilZ domain-containing protein [Anaeromyxobacter oryzae]|uniref:PilZ domain-containing protein n=1 Tax=Anaeromyxobacter oryzae TaxID=2918170 RepID=A0ABM7X224_9BACT|nr:PilZ domain-containing protein [Anaeromyxobacter oryzae]BDG05837.1 hypothetical protein AMOR_48330 [Anaeromyxobacter oryzae]